jgi:hypothetical protein
MAVYVNKATGAEVSMPDSVILDPKFYEKRVEKSADAEVPVKTATGTPHKRSKTAKKVANKR